MFQHPFLHRSLLISLIGIAGTVGLAWAEEPATEPTPSEIRFVEGIPATGDEALVLQRFIGHAVTFANELDSEALRKKCSEEGPEMFCWEEFKYLNALNVAYELTRDTAYLDQFRDAFARFQEMLEKGPDGYLGWYGQPIKPRQISSQPDLKIDEMQMNFRAMAILSQWVELARTDPAYAAENEAVIQKYLNLMTEHLFPKWDARGHFAVIPGRGGVYHGLDYPHPQQVSLSFEKLAIALDGCLGLYRVTHDAKYLKRALQIGAWFKSNLNLVDGHYEWLSWVPSGRWDINPDKEDSWRVGWMGADPNGGWYSEAASIALKLYQYGLLFGDEDLQRFVKTQKEMCWNGDLENPEYRTVDGTSNKWTKGRFLSVRLAHYDPVLEKLAFEGPHEGDVKKNSTSAWKGGANAQEYVREKYVMRPVIAKTPKPYGEMGEAFLKDPENKAFYDVLNQEVVAPGPYAPRKPSELYVVP